MIYWIKNFLKSYFAYTLIVRRGTEIIVQMVIQATNFA